MKRNPTFNRILLIFWMAVIFAGSSLPSDDIPKPISPLSSMLHFTEYLILAAISYPLLPGWALMAFCALFAISDEIHQIFVPGRIFSYSDIAFDIAGAYLGLVLARNLGGSRCF